MWEKLLADKVGGNKEDEGHLEQSKGARKRKENETHGEVDIRERGTEDQSWPAGAVGQLPTSSG